MARAAAGRRATLRDIAEVAGVSVPTVSKVVKGRADVSAETRARIQALLDAHGYVPRGTDQARAGSRTIELCFSGMANANNLETMRGAVEAAERAGVHVVVKITPRDAAVTAWVDRVIEAQHAGVILVTSRLPRAQQEQLAGAGIPIVVIDPVNTPLEEMPSVGVNNFSGAYLATKHLLDLGHREIAMVTGVDSECAAARLAGYHEAVRERGVTPRPEWIQTGDFTYEGGRRAGERILGGAPLPTAVFAANDLEALAVIDVARSRGLRLPEELSIVGFDDSIQAISASPSLTTVRQPFAEIGATAVQLLLQLVDGRPLASRRLELTTQLVVRQSTAPPRR